MVLLQCKELEANTHLHTRSNQLTCSNIRQLTSKRTTLLWGTVVVVNDQLRSSSNIAQCAELQCRRSFSFQEAIAFVKVYNAIDVIDILHRNNIKPMGCGIVLREGVSVIIMLDAFEINEMKRFTK